MFTTGSKLLIGSAVLAIIAGLVYGISQDDPAQGTVGLLSAGIALSFLAGVNVWARDSNLSSMDVTAVAASEAAANPPGNSVWPMVFAVGGGATLFGLVTQQSIFTIGIVILVAAGAQWAVQNWADSASTDSEVNTAVRGRLANPLEYPLLGAIAFGGIAFSLSRMMLWLSSTSTVIAFSILATVISFTAFFFALRPSVKRGAIGGVLAVGAIAIVAGGVAAGVDGQREIHAHETIGADAAKICDSAEETEVDENMSQTVSIKSSVAAEVILTKSGDLTFDVPGPVESGATELTLPRSSANNIIFRNESSEPRRLTVNLAKLTDEELAAATEAEADTHETGHGASEAATEEGAHAVRHQLCTTLIEQGGAQLLTLDLDIPSVDPLIANDADAYRFVVPGTDAELGLFVP